MVWIRACDCSWPWDLWCLTARSRTSKVNVEEPEQGLIHQCVHFHTFVQTFGALHKWQGWHQTEVMNGTCGQLILSRKRGTLPLHRSFLLHPKCQNRWSDQHGQPLAAWSLSRLQEWPEKQQGSQREQQQAGENQESCNRSHQPGQAWSERSRGRRSWRRGCPWGSRPGSPCIGRRSQAPCTRSGQTLFGLYNHWYQNILESIILVQNYHYPAISPATWSLILTISRGFVNITYIYVDLISICISKSQKL